MLKCLFLLWLFPGITFGDEIKLMTWNTFMLPWPVRSSHQEMRTQAMEDFLRRSEFDVIFLQEAFTSRFQRTLETALKEKYPHSFRPEKKPGLFPFLGPGLMVLSKFPLKAVDHVYFDQCASFDCFASKGAHLVELTLPSGKKLQVTNTHMQAGTRYTDIRKLQLDQIRKMMNDHKRKSVPQLLVGDLNIDPALGDEFTGTLALLRMNPVKHELFLQAPPAKAPVSQKIKDFFSAGYEVTCLKDNKGSRPKLIDHVLYFEPDQEIRFMNDQILFPEFDLKGKPCALSDHRPRVVTLKVQ